VNTKIYSGLGQRNVIPYVIAGKLQDRVLVFASSSSFVWLGLPFIAGQRCLPTTLLSLINVGFKLHSYAPRARSPKSLPWSQESSLRCALSFQFCLGGGGVYMPRIHAPYLRITSHLLCTGYRRLERTHFDVALHPIYLDTGAIHDALAEYCPIVFC
jgi:hypothetical protein